MVPACDGETDGSALYLTRALAYERQKARIDLHDFGSEQK